VDTLKNIDVIISNNMDSESINDIKIDLHNFLKSQQERLDDNTSVVEHKATIKCNPGLDDRLLMQDDGESSIVDRICNIKTTKVEWEGVSSFMHVFIDMTDFYKLEEAKNNIKLQKIMFASASHEFRTPLNAIMMSYEFIKSSNQIYTDLMNPYGGLSRRDSQRVDKCKSDITKFTDIGYSSSVLLLSLIEDVLDLSKMEAGTFKINIDDFMIPGLIQEVASIFSIQ
jgi:signal transduction histidine kinase